MAIIVKGTVKIARPIVPTDIAGLTLWLDASDSTTLFQNSDGTTPAIADSDPIGYWGDKSGNGNNVIQSDVSLKPSLKLTIQNNKNTLRFDGTNDKLTGNLSPQSSDRTMFIVAKRTSTTSAWRGAILLNANDINDQTGTTQYIIQQAGNGTNSLGGGRPAGGLEYTYTGNGTNYFIISQTNTLTGSAAKMNGASAGSVSHASTSIGTGVQVRIGSGRLSNTETWYGDIAEVIVYNSVLSAYNIVFLESYLNTKWGAY